jgi:hypothetical protein
MRTPPIAEVRERLERLFPEGVYGRGFLVRELAAKTIATFLFLDAVGDPDQPGKRLLRPSMVTWMDDASLGRTDDDAFVAGWHSAAARNQATLKTFLADQGVVWSRWYADNSREPIRDEVIRPLHQSYGAVLRRLGLAATGGSPALSLAPDFASVFEEGLSGDELAARIERWQRAHLGAAEQARLAALPRLSAEDTVSVQLPGRGARQLPAGLASQITARVVTDLAPQLLDQPFVLAICHSRDPVAAEDARELESVGLALDANLALPDVLLMDVGDGTVWFVEVVVSAGEINESRRKDLATWAAARGITPERCRYITAYRSRSDAAFRRTVGDLAWESYAWFADEPHGIWLLSYLTNVDRV